MWGLLFPAFLAGAVAVGVPIYLHLARRRPTHERPWSSLRFLTPGRPRFEGRRRFQDLALLALRALVVVLLALAFARPFHTPPGEAVSGAAGKRVVVLVDVSASMRGGGAWPAAREAALARLRATAGADRVAVLTFADGARPLVGFDEAAGRAPAERAALVASRLAAQPGWGATDLGGALVAAVDAIAADMAAEGARAGEIVVVSDLREGARLDAAEGLRWPRGVALTLRRVGAGARDNVSLTAVSSGEASGASDASAAKTRVRVTRTPGSGSARSFDVADEHGVARAQVVLAPGETRVVELPLLPAARMLRLFGDADDFDDRLAVAPPVPRTARVLYVGPPAGRDDARSPLYFISRALPPSRLREAIVDAYPAGDPRLGAAARVADLVVVPGALPEVDRRALAPALARGKVVLWALDSAAAIDGPVALAKRAGVRAVDAEGTAKLAHVDLRHPLLAPFSDPRFGDFAKIRFWRHRVIEPGSLGAGVEILARFDDGGPALFVWPVDGGRLVVLAAGLSPGDGQLPLSSKFVPFLEGLLDAGAGAAATEPRHFVGDPIPLPADVEAVRTPAGRRVPARGRFTGADEPGLYELLAAGDRARGAVAVWLSPAESVTAPLPDARVLRFAGTAEAIDAETTAAARGTSASWEAEQKLWRPLLLGVLAALVLETIGAAIWGRRRPGGDHVDARV